MKSAGIFKGLYRGEGIYWNGNYNVDGSGAFDTRGEAEHYIDRLWEQRAKKEKEEKDQKLEAGAILATREGDTVTVHFPDGTRSVPIREYRQNVFDWEEHYGREIVWG